ncbi:MAG TPA: (2Fe-2S)-binding protein [Burkholderiales bacterium]|jgi:Rieske Fe-S protein|nr:(2Fe-2S)-binding protein [Burkholderiales bacterium]
MQRRDFIKVCAATTAVAAQSAFPAADMKPRFYARARLVDDHKRPLKAASLAIGENYIFHYPFEGTPCFLLNLGRPTVQNVELKTDNGASYLWPGGAGASHAIVSYSAICAHRMTYPTRQISFISYRGRSTASKISRPNTIHCCSEHSEYDPAAGARVLGGPAPQPLAAILLEHDAASDGLYAVGTLGGELFNAFFDKFDFKLALDYGAGRPRQRVADTALVTTLQNFCKQQVKC